MSTQTTSMTGVAPLTQRGASWVNVAPGFWAATLEGEFYGTIDEVKDGYVSRDAHGEPIGVYATLRDARNSLRSTDTPRNKHHRKFVERMQFAAATLAGVGALTLALTAGALVR